MKILGLSGYAGAGKDTTAALLIEEWGGWTRLAFADPIKAALHTLNPVVPFFDTHARVAALVDQHGWDWVKNNVPEARRLLQTFGTEVGRDMFGVNFWVDQTLNAAKHADPRNKFVVTDVRFPNEVDAIRALGGTIVRVHRRGVGPPNAHRSETTHLDVDYHLDNHGDLAELRANIVDLFLGYA